MERPIHASPDTVLENYSRQSGCFLTTYRLGGDVRTLRFNTPANEYTLSDHFSRLFQRLGRPYYGRKTPRMRTTRSVCIKFVWFTCCTMEGVTIYRTCV